MPPAIVAAGISALATVATSILNKPETPKAKPAVPMPGQGAEDAARRQSIMEQQKRMGRASTILTDGSDTLG